MKDRELKNYFVKVTGTFFKRLLTEFLLPLGIYEGIDQRILWK